MAREGKMEGLGTSPGPFLYYTMTGVANSFAIE